MTRKKIKLNVTVDAVDVLSPVPTLLSGEYKTTEAEFTFSEEWNGLIKKAKFGSIEPIILENDKCIVPTFDSAGKIEIKVFGYNSEIVEEEEVYTLIYSPSPAKNLFILQGSYDEDGTDPIKPIPPIEYATKEKLWNGFKEFFGTLTTVPQEAIELYEYTDSNLAVLNLQQTFSNIEKIDNIISNVRDEESITKSKLWNGYKNFFTELEQPPRNAEQLYNETDAAFNVLTLQQIYTNIERINNEILEAHLSYVEMIKQFDDFNDYSVNATLKNRFGIYRNRPSTTSGMGSVYYAKVIKLSKFIPKKITAILNQEPKVTSENYTYVAFFSSESPYTEETVNYVAGQLTYSSSFDFSSVFVNGTITSAYTRNGNTITFNAAHASGDVITFSDYIGRLRNQDVSTRQTITEQGTTAYHCTWQDFSIPSNAKSILIFKYSYGTRFTSYKQQIEGVSVSGSDDKREDYVNKTLCSFSEAYSNWCSGGKFPILICGDSTIAGSNTSDPQGKTKAWVKRLEEKLRYECQNSTLTLYNLAVSGSKTGTPSMFDTWFNQDNGQYKDSKMVGIGWGINDAYDYTDAKAYYDHIYEYNEALVKKAFELGVQPFLITSQSTLKRGNSPSGGGYSPFWEGENFEIIGNNAKRDIAKAYNLEIIDLNVYSRKYLKNSSVPVSTIISDRLHFGDVGNLFEAGAVFRDIVKRTVTIKNKDEYKIGFLDQCIKQNVNKDHTLYGSVFKAYYNYDGSDELTEDTKIIDAYVYFEDYPSIVKAYKSDSTSTTYVKIDREIPENTQTILLDELEKSIGTLDVGLHHLEVFTGNSLRVDFKGFTINETV